jgi:hypothetical protein
MREKLIYGCFLFVSGLKKLKISESKVSAHLTPSSVHTCLQEVGLSLMIVNTSTVLHLDIAYWSESLSISSITLNHTWPPHAILVSDGSISKKSSPLKLLSHMNRNLVGSICMYGRFCIKFPQSRMKGKRHRLSPLSL